MTEDFTTETTSEIHPEGYKKCSRKMNGKQKCIAIIASVALVVGGGIINTALESSTAIEKASIAADASIQRADIMSHAHTTKNINVNIKDHKPNHPRFDDFNQIERVHGEGGGELQKRMRELFGPEAPEIIIQKFQRSFDDGSAMNMDKDGVIDPGNFSDGGSLIAPPPGFHDDNVIQPSAFHKGHKGKKSGISEISDNDESVGNDGVDPSAAANPMDQLKSLSSAQKAQALNSVAGAFDSGNIDISQLTKYCPQITKALAGKSQDQIDAYEMAVGAQLAPGNESQAKKILDNVIKTCNTGGATSGATQNSASDDSGT